MFYLIVGFEHILLAMKWIVGWALKDVPSEVERTEAFKAIMKERSLQAKEEADASFLCSKNRTAASENRPPLEASVLHK